MKPATKYTQEGPSAVERLILAAATLTKDGQADFTAEDLAVAAWKASPETFGLAGYKRLYPNFNAVAASLAHKSGPVRRFFFDKVRPKVFRLSWEGQKFAARLAGEDFHEADSAYVQLSHARERFLFHLFTCQAYLNFRSGTKADLTFSQATRFWAIGDARGEAVAERLKAFETTLNEIEAALESKDARLTGGRIFTAADVRHLRNLHSYLLDRFGRFLSGCRNSVPTNT